MTLRDDDLYDAVLRRDSSFEGVFFVGVRTTGVFCRPTCPGRAPKRANCEFFPDAQAALLAAYRPCRRCRPMSRPNETTAIVRRLVEMVERDPSRRWRPEDFAGLAIHPATARRHFRKRFGMTFAQYARARRLGSGLQSIRRGERIIMAQLDAGYDSPSGFRDAFAKLLGAPPSARSARALSAGWLDTPLGPMIAIGDDDALYLLEFMDRPGLDHQVRRLRAQAKAALVPARARLIEAIGDELAAYFDGRLARFDTPLAPRGTAFQRAIWFALRRIPLGATLSYAALARSIGRPKAVRAAGAANGANPWAIVVPCHRVVGAGGALVGYAGGVARKRWLIEHERNVARALAA